MDVKSINELNDNDAAEVFRRYCGSTFQIVSNPPTLVGTGLKNRRPLFSARFKNVISH